MALTDYKTKRSRIETPEVQGHRKCVFCNSPAIYTIKGGLCLCDRCGRSYMRGRGIKGRKNNNHAHGRR